MTDRGPRSPEVDIESHLLVNGAFAILQEMATTEGFASTEDSYTARIPGKTLRRWHDALDKVLFRLRSELDV